MSNTYETVRQEIPEIEKIVSKCENLKFSEFEAFVKTLDVKTMHNVLKRFASIKDFYEKNLTIYPEFDKKGGKNYVYKRSQSQLTMIKKKGKFLVEQIKSHNE